MKTKYQTLDEYLDVLDQIKEQIAAETAGMTAVQVRAYFARARRELRRATQTKPRVRRRKLSTPR